MSALALPEALRACRNVSPPSVARRAAAAWEMAVTHGWEAVQATLPRSTFYRYLRILQRAGLPAPEPRGGTPRAGAEALAASESRADPVDLAAWLQTAGGLLGMPGRRFRVARAWDRYTLVGTVGTVYAVLFRKGRWVVCAELDDSPGSFEELAIGRFALCTVWQDDTGDGSTS